MTSTPTQRGSLPYLPWWWYRLRRLLPFTQLASVPEASMGFVARLVKAVTLANQHAPETLVMRRSC